MRKTIQVRGARENNLRNVSVEIPRDKLTVVTGVSGSGKSSLAFRHVVRRGPADVCSLRCRHSPSVFVAQLKKPDVDFVNGLSPVVSIDQKTVGNNPRSTVGTMTDIWDYLRMLFATIGVPRCPLCLDTVNHVDTASDAGNECSRSQRARKWKSARQYSRSTAKIMSIWWKQIRSNGYRQARVDEKLLDLGQEQNLDDGNEHRIEAVVDSFIVQKGIDKQVVASLEHGAKLGDGFLSFHIVGGKVSKTQQAKVPQGIWLQTTSLRCQGPSSR